MNWNIGRNSNYLRLKGDERILWSSEFVEQVLKKANEQLDQMQVSHRILSQIQVLIFEGPVGDYARQQQVYPLARQKDLVEVEELIDGDIANHIFLAALLQNQICVAVKFITYCRDDLVSR